MKYAVPRSVHTMFTGNALTGKRRLCYGTHNVPRQAAFCGLTAAGRRRATEGRVHMGKRMLTSWLVLAMLSIAPGGLAIAQAIPPAASGAAADADPSADTQPGAAAHTQPETAADANGQALTPTAQWTPPDLSALTAHSAPELLVLKVAQEELGYVEGPLTDESKYGEWFCSDRCAWCAEFLTWCVDQVDQRYGLALLENLYPRYGGPSTGVPFFIDKGRFISDNGKLPTNEKEWLIGCEHYLAANEYIPHVGDYIWFYYYNRTVGTDHVAIVEGVSVAENGAVTIHVIEGNNPDRVQRAVYDLADQRIYGFGTPVKRAYCNLRLYNRCDDVLCIQQALADQGYYDMEPGQEGIFTQALAEAVKCVQRDLHLKATGILDMETHTAMEAADILPLLLPG